MNRKITALDKSMVENFLRMNDNMFTVKEMDGAFRVHMKIEKSDFNPEIARFLYDHGNKTFKSVKGANYSDVQEHLERVIMTRDAEKAKEYLIKDTVNVMDAAIRQEAKVEKAKEAFGSSSEQRKEAQQGFMARIMSSLGRQVDSGLAIDRA